MYSLFACAALLNCRLRCRNGAQSGMPGYDERKEMGCAYMDFILLKRLRVMVRVRIIFLFYDAICYAGFLVNPCGHN